MASLLPILRGLLAYTMWADRQVLQAWPKCEEDLTRDTGTAFGSVLGTHGHILGAEQLWLSRFWVSAPGPPVAPRLSLYQLLHSSYEDFWPSSSTSSLRSRRSRRWRSSRGGRSTASRRQALFVRSSCTSPITHYHRGQVASQLRQLGRPRRPTW